MRERLAFLHTLDATWTDVSEASLRASRRRAAASTRGSGRRWRWRARPVRAAAQACRGRAAVVGRLAPTHVVCRRGSRIPGTIRTATRRSRSLQERSGWRGHDRRARDVASRSIAVAPRIVRCGDAGPRRLSGAVYAGGAERSARSVSSGMRRGPLSAADTREAASLRCNTGGPGDRPRVCDERGTDLEN